MEIILHKIGKVLDETYQRNSQFIGAGVRQRMASCLSELAKSFGTEDPDGIRIKLQLSREELAAFLGVANETAIRFISEFKRMGILDERDHFLIIKQKTKLEAMYKGGKYEDL
jgi:CRP-like cAMP-binding protein